VGKRVLLTGHTGFKGGWLALWLADLGAEVTGYALAPGTSPALYEAAGVANVVRSVIADVRESARLETIVSETRPDFVFHLAAQAIVRTSYEEPVETFDVNVLGTARLLEALRRAGRPVAVVVVTSDKCYENCEWPWGYRENEALGGHDPYSASKAAAELVVSAYRRSFFPPARLAGHGLALASARAGNVVGGGDWGRDRLVPDAVAALVQGNPIPVRNPDAVRPWQHVLEPLAGYLLLGARLSGVGTRSPADHCEAWNFGPRTEDSRPVRDVVDALVAAWGAGSWEDRHDRAAPHEAGSLRLAIDKARARLGWSPRWGFEETLRRTTEWYRAFHAGAGPGELAALCRQQIARYLDEKEA
jgi:CDP-glucose 4,6-dehydratase